MKGGRLRIAEVTLPTATRGERTLTVGAWEGQRGCLTTSLIGSQTERLVEVFDTLAFSERSRGLAVDSPVTARPREPEVTTEVPGLGVLGIRPAISSVLERIPRARGHRTSHGELFRIRATSNALTLVTSSAVTAIQPLDKGSPDELVGLARASRSSGPRPSEQLRDGPRARVSRGGAATQRRHASRPVRAFHAVVRAHGVVPSRAAAPVALLVAVTETALGAAAAIAAMQSSVPPVLFAAAAVLGVGFILYLRALLRRPDSGVGCGCTPLPAPLGPASLLPGGMLAVIAILALAATATGARAADTTFPLLWGATLALLVVLVPASVPQPATEGGR